MKTLALLFLAIAGPASAQVDPATALRETDLMGQQDLARQRDIARYNRITTLETQVETDQRLQALAAHNLDPRPPAPVIPAYPAAKPSGPWPQISDAALAASRERVLAASRNRR